MLVPCCRDVTDRVGLVVLIKYIYLGHNYQYYSHTILVECGIWAAPIMVEVEL